MHWTTTDHSPRSSGQTYLLTWCYKWTSSCQYAVNTSLLLFKLQRAQTVSSKRKLEDPRTTVTCRRLRSLRQGSCVRAPPIKSCLLRYSEAGPNQIHKTQQARKAVQSHHICYNQWAVSYTVNRERVLNWTELISKSRGKLIRFSMVKILFELW